MGMRLHHPALSPSVRAPAVAASSVRTCHSAPPARKHLRHVFPYQHRAGPIGSPSPRTAFSTVLCSRYCSGISVETNPSKRSTTKTVVPSQPTPAPLRSKSTMANAENEVDTYEQVFHANSKWRASVAETNPALFASMSKGQSPKILWIGCSDSRCPETTVLGLQPGDVFVHRNIANILVPTDLNSLSVIQYAVQYLQVKHVVICGHTSCGGVAAALDNKKLGLIDTWLMPLRTLRQQNLQLLQSLNEKDRSLKLVELNVRHGVKVLEENPVVLDAMSERGLKVHGLIYDVGSGDLRELEIHEDEEVVSTRKTVFKVD